MIPIAATEVSASAPSTSEPGSRRPASRSPRSWRSLPRSARGQGPVGPKRAVPLGVEDVVQGRPEGVEPRAATAPPASRTQIDRSSICTVPASCSNARVQTITNHTLATAENAPVTRVSWSTGPLAGSDLAWADPTARAYHRVCEASFAHRDRREPVQPVGDLACSRPPGLRSAGACPRTRSPSSTPRGLRVDGSLERRRPEQGLQGWWRWLPDPRRDPARPLYRRRRRPGITRITIETGIPVAFGLITAETGDHASARSGGAQGNKGEKAAAALMDTLTSMDAIARAVAQGVRAKSNASKRISLKTNPRTNKRLWPPRLIRRLAFRALYQLDAVKDAELDRVRASIDIDEDLKPGEVDKRSTWQARPSSIAGRRRRGRRIGAGGLCTASPRWTGHCSGWHLRDDPRHDAAQGRRRRGRETREGIQHRSPRVRQRDPRQAAQARARNQQGRHGRSGVVSDGDLQSVVSKLRWARPRRARASGASSRCCATASSMRTDRGDRGRLIRADVGVTAARASAAASATRTARAR